jgi:hypothetical protein
MPRLRFFALLCLSVLSSRVLLGQKTPDRPPIDLSPPAPAAEPPSKGDPFSGSLFAGWGVPVGAFHRHEDGGGELGFTGAYAIDPTKHVSLRLEGGFLAYGYVSRHADVPAYDDFGGFDGYDNVSYAVRQHQMFTLDVGPEVTALRGSLRPYGFATGGLSYFVSKMNVRPPQYSGDDPIDQTVFSSGNFAWSTGVGLRIGSRDRDARSGLFDIGVRFRRNERARYANDRAISTLSDGTIVVTPFYGSANLITIYAGFWVGPKSRH